MEDVKKNHLRLVMRLDKIGQMRYGSVPVVVERSFSRRYALTTLMFQIARDVVADFFTKPSTDLVDQVLVVLPLAMRNREVPENTFTGLLRWLAPSKSGEVLQASLPQWWEEIGKPTADGFLRKGCDLIPTLPPEWSEVKKWYVEKTPGTAEPAKNWFVHFCLHREILEVVRELATPELAEIVETSCREMDDFLRPNLTKFAFLQPLRASVTLELRDDLHERFWWWTREV